MKFRQAFSGRCVQFGIIGVGSLEIQCSSRVLSVSVDWCGNVGCVCMFFVCVR